MLNFDKNKQIFILISLFYILFIFLFNAQFYLWEQDEAAYAGFGRHILQTGDWVVPDFIWSNPHRKTPFHFWAIATSFYIFGENEFALRLPTNLFFLGTLALQFFMGKRLFGKENALIATLVLAFSLMLPSFAKIALTDITLLFFQTLCAFSIIAFMEKPNWKTNIIIWFSMSLGILTKGPTIIMMAGTMFFLLLIFHPYRWRVFRTHPWFGLPLALSPLLLWGRLAWQHDNGTFITWLIDWYILKRASGQVVFGQTGPVGYYLAFFILSFMPFILFFPKTLQQFFGIFFQKQSKTVYDTGIYIAIWAISGWLMYEFIPSKLPSYAFGAMPAFAFGIAKLIQETDLESIKRQYIGWFLQIFVGIALSLALIVIGNQPNLVVSLTKLSQNFAHNAQIIINIFAPIFLIINILSCYFWYRGEKQKGIYASIGTASAFTILIWSLLYCFNTERDMPYRLAQIVATQPQRTVIFPTCLDLPSAPFYVGETNKYEYSENINIDALKKRFDSDEKIFMIIEEEDLEIFKSFRLSAKKEHIIKGFISDKGFQTFWTVIEN